MKENYNADLHQNNITMPLQVSFKLLSVHQKTLEALLYSIDKTLRKLYRKRRSLRSSKFTAKDYGTIK